MLGVEQWAELRRLHFVQGVDPRAGAADGLAPADDPAGAAVDSPASLHTLAAAVEARSVQGGDPAAVAGGAAAAGQRVFWS